MLIPHRYKSLLPPLYSAENQKDPIVQLKFFNPTGAQSWFLIEYSPEENLAFGWVDLGSEPPELGYFSITELECINLPFGLSIERDIHFIPCRLSTIKAVAV